MSNTSVARSDFSEFEAQFSSSVRVAPTQGQLRVRGWVIALIASAVLWAAIAVGIAAAIHALS
jgi:hypothetical protein